MIQLTPLLGLCGVCCYLGYRLAILIPAAGRIYGLAAFLILLLASIILETEPGWNLALLLALSIAAGTLLYWSGAVFQRWQTWVTFFAGVSSAVLLSSLVGDQSARASRILFPSTILYLAGWILILMIDLPGPFKMVWVISGLLLFTLIAAAVLADGRKKGQTGGLVPLSSRMFVILFNLLWLSGSLW